MKNKENKYLKLKNPVEVYDCSTKLLDNNKDYPVGSIVYTKFKKSPRYITKSGHYKFLYKVDVLKDNLVGYPVKKKNYYWIRVK